MVQKGYNQILTLSGSNLFHNSVVFTNMNMTDATCVVFIHKCINMIGSASKFYIFKIFPGKIISIAFSIEKNIILN